MRNLFSAEGVNVPENLLDRIEINPAVMLGKPVIKGTRIPVELIVRKLSEGATEGDLLDGYPRLTPLDIQAALAYAANALAHETIILQTA
jgi:uncharacterized protein (DUF433 family)